MPLELLPVEEADLPTFYDILWESGKKDAISARMWPNGYPQAARDWSVAQSANDMREDSEKEKYMKVIDTDLPEDDAYRKILSIARWQVYPRDRTDEEVEEEGRRAKEKGAPPGANVAFVEDFFSSVGKRKTEIVGNKAYVYLALLFTHPDRFRRGAGRMHVQWGLDLADKLGVPAYLEASQMGRPLYERMGFEYVSDLPLDNKKWELDQDFAISCLLRPSRKVNGEGI